MKQFSFLVGMIIFWGSLGSLGLFGILSRIGDSSILAFTIPVSFGMMGFDIFRAWEAGQ